MGLSNLEVWKAKQRGHLLALLTLWLEDRRSMWRGTATELRNALAGLLGENAGIPMAHSMASTIRELEPDLATLGWTLTQLRTGAGRAIILTPVPSP